jgi:hypothetical protein
MFNSGFWTNTQMPYTSQTGFWTIQAVSVGPLAAQKPIFQRVGRLGTFGPLGQLLETPGDQRQLAERGLPEEHITARERRELVAVDASCRRVTPNAAREPVRPEPPPVGAPPRCPRCGDTGRKRRWLSRERTILYCPCGGHIILDADQRTEAKR